MRGLSRRQHWTKVKLQVQGYANQLVFKVCCLTAFECSSVCSGSEALHLAQCCLNVLHVFRHPLLERYSQCYKEKVAEMSVRVVPIPIPVSESFLPIRFNIVNLLETGPCRFPAASSAPVCSLTGRKRRTKCIRASVVVKKRERLKRTSEPLLHFHTRGRSLLEHLIVSSSLQGF